MIYLDNAGTTKPSDAVISKAMEMLASGEFGNPGSKSCDGMEAKEQVTRARRLVAEKLFCGVPVDEVVFTSGGSEGNNLIIKGLKEYLRFKHKTEIIISNVEHDSVDKAAHSLETDGFTVRYIEVEKNTGTVNPDKLDEMITENTGLVSIMYVNNELGTTNPVKEIAAVCHKHGVLYHTDAVQAAGLHKLNVNAIGCDFMTVAGHKIKTA